VYDFSVSYHQLGRERFEKQLSEVDGPDKKIHLSFHYPPEAEDLRKISKKLSNSINLTISIWYDPKKVKKEQCAYNFLEEFPELNSLWFKYTPWIESLEFLESVPRLKFLDICQNKNNRLSVKPIGNLKNLKELILEGYQNDISCLEKCDSLAMVTLSRSPLADFSFLNGVPNLWYLKIGQSKIKAMEQAENLKIKYLELWLMPNIKDISFAAKLKSMEELMIDQLNNLEKIESCSELKRLENVKIERCKKLKDISGLAAAQKLTSLRIYDCANLIPESFNAFTDHPNLRYGILDIGDEEKNRKLEELLPLSTPSGYPEVHWSKFQN